MATSKIAQRFGASLSIVIVAGVLAAQQEPPASQSHALNVDSTYLDNTGTKPRVVFQRVVQISGAEWTRLFFDKTHLPDGSELRLTALKDNAVQRLDGRSLRDYGNSSCFFNGDAVRLELLAGPRTTANRVLVVRAVAGIRGAYPDSICGNSDDRVQSFDKRQGRLSSGCTGWLINSDVMVTAGHCVGSSLILSFNVPKSTSSGGLNQSHPDDQYAVVGGTVRSVNGGIGADWGVGRLAANSNTGKLPGDAQGSWYSLGAVPSTTSGQNIRITGYGTTSPRNDLNQVQKTHVGPLRTVASVYLQYHTDTTGGNSGSPIIHDNTGNAVGIHTHGGCSTNPSSSNHGTRIDRTDLQSAIQALQGKAGSTTPFGTGCKGSNGSVPAMSGSSNPQIGRLGSIEVKNLLPQKFGFFVFGVSNTKSKAGYGLPFDLSIIGMPTCYQLSSESVFQPFVSLVNGTVGWSGYLPRDPNMVGTSFYSQYFSSDPTVNALGTTASNGVKFTIGG